MRLFDVIVSVIALTIVSALIIAVSTLNGPGMAYLGYIVAACALTGAGFNVAIYRTRVRATRD